VAGSPVTEHHLQASILNRDEEVLLRKEVDIPASSRSTEALRQADTSSSCIGSANRAYVMSSARDEICG
jgi:hypothetical protein